MAAPRRSSDRLLASLLVGLWLGCLAVGLRGAVTGRVAMRGPVVAAPANPGDLPAVVGDRPGSVFEVGDRIQRVGRSDAAGMGPFAFYTTWFIEADSRETLDVVVERGGAREELAVPLDLQLPAWLFFLLGFSFGVPGIAVFMRVPPTTQTRLLLAASTVFSDFFMLLPPPTGPSWFASWMPITLVIGCTSAPLVVNAAQAIPAEAAPRSRKGWAWPWLLWPAFCAAMTSYWFGLPLTPAAGLRLYNAVGAAFSLAILAVLTRNYVRSGAIGRRQLRWLLWGFYVGLAPMLAIDALSTLRPELNALQGPSGLFQILIPISVAIAVACHNLYDVDRLISATASYSVLSTLFVSSTFAIAPRFASAMSVAAGIDPDVGQTLVAVLLALVFVSGHRFVRPALEMAFFPVRHRLERGVEELIATLGDASTAEEMLTRAARGLDELVEPETCALYARTDEVYENLFARGRAVPPALSPGQATLRAFRDRMTAVDLDRLARELSEREVALLAGGGSAVAVPVVAQGELVALLVLGARSSGDVYTSTDLALLTAVGSRLSAGFLDFDYAQFRAEARSMAKNLRRYVPGAVAAVIEEGHELESEEREVSVLFADLRGYTAFSQDHSPQEIFAAVSRHTERVTAIVARHGGAVVEFNGDGMMAVFGAPRSLTCKERSALESALDIAIEGTNDVLAVGVGVATGPALVGNIRAVDRWIWSALGNPTNLAARLQSMTRDFEAAVAVDELTLESAGASHFQDFERRDRVRVRGRSEPLCLYVLPRRVLDANPGVSRERQLQ